MPVKKEFEVIDAEAKEISLCGKGMNGEEEFLMFKSKDEEEENKEGDEKQETDMDKTENDSNPIEETDKTEKGGNSNVEFDEIKESFGDLEKEKQKELLEESDVELEKEANDDGEDPEEDFKKELPEEARERLEKQEEELEKMREERELDEMRKKVSKYDVLPGDVEENAKLFKSVKNSDEEAYEDLLEKIEAIEEQVDLEKTFEEAGGSDPSPEGDAVAKVEELVEKKMEKGDYDSRAQAEAAIWKEKPELAEQYYQEQ